MRCYRTSKGVPALPLRHQIQVKRVSSSEGYDEIHGAIVHDKLMSVEPIICILAYLAERLDILATAQMFEVDLEMAPQRRRS
jgi:hypothetical protein